MTYRVSHTAHGLFRVDIDSTDTTQCLADFLESEDANICVKMITRFRDIGQSYLILRLHSTAKPAAHIATLIEKFKQRYYGTN